MDRQALGAAVRRRRLELDLTLDALALAAGMSKQTVIRVEKGEDVQARTLYRLDRALGWVIGAAEALLYSGREPTLLPIEYDPGDPEETEIWGLTRLAEDTRRALIAELRRQRRADSDTA